MMNEYTKKKAENILISFPFIVFEFKIFSISLINNKLIRPQRYVTAGSENPQNCFFLPDIDGNIKIGSHLL